MMGNTVMLNRRTMYYLLLLLLCAVVDVVPEYPFLVHEVDFCPITKSAWHRAGVKYNCSYDKNNRLQYMCLPEKDKQSLLEFCHDEEVLLHEKGYCLLLASEGRLEQADCKSFEDGCPEDRYYSSELYKYSSCFEIDTLFKCFTAEKICVARKWIAIILGAIGGLILVVVVFLFLLSEEEEDLEILQKRNCISLEGLNSKLDAWKKDNIDIAVNDFSNKYIIDGRRILINYFSEKDCGVYQGFRLPTRRGCFIRRKRSTYPVTVEIQKLKLVGVTYDISEDTLLEETQTTDFFSIWESESEKEKPCIVLLTEMSSVSSPSVQSNIYDPNRNSRLVLILKCAALLSNNFKFSWTKNVLKDIEQFMAEIPHKIEEYKSVASSLKPCSSYKSTNSFFKLLSDEVVLETLWIMLNQCRSPKEVLKYIFDNKLRTLTKKFFRLEGYIQHPDESFILLPRSVANIYLKSLIDANFEFTGNPWMTNDEFDQRSCTNFECFVYYALLTNLPTSEIVLKYFATSGYVEKKEEICIIVPPEYNERVIQKMDVDIIAHKTIHDVCIHEAVIRLLRIPKEVLEWDDERRERFVQELKDGKVRVHRARIIIVGCAGAGKTTLVERLKHPNNDEMPTTTTTVGLDVHRNVFHVDDGRLISMENTTSITVSSREEKMITLMDFAGQSAYYACHQVFLTKRAIYVLVSDMSKCMDDKVSQLECDTKGTVFADWKHGDYIRFWLQSIRTYCGENMPVVLVATHKDKNISNENFFDEILHSLPEEQNLKKHISTQRYFEIGATPEDKETIFDIQKLLLHLLSPENGEQQYSHWGEFIPSFWLSVERDLELSGVKVMHVSEMTKRFNLKKETVKIQDMLQFFHDIGYILFFNETSLNSVAILDVQWFIDAFKSITMDENQGNAMKDTNNPNQQFLWIKDFFSKPKDWNNFYHLGKLPCKTLVDFWESHGDKDFKEYGDIILKYMERLGLLVIGKNFHYIPCVNKMDIKTSLLARISSERYEKTSVICFRFKHCLHHFFFQRVVVSCMHEWKYLEIDGTPGLFKNIVLLEHKPKGFIIAIGVNKTSIQLLVYSISRSLHSSDTCKVRDTVEKILSSVVKTFHKAVEYEVGFSCMEKDKITKESEGRFILEEEAVDSAKAAEKGECFCNSNAPHNVNWRKMIKYWRKERNLRIRSREGTNPTRRYFSNQQRGDDLKNARSYEMQEHEESQVWIDIEDHHSEHGIFQVSDEESKKHYWRVIEKLIGISRDALKVYFDCKLSPQDLEKTLKLYGDEMKKGPYRFTEDQLLIMFPGDGSCPLSSMFDVSIMYKLLRNYVEDLPTPTKGWGKKPEIGDIKETDDLERIRIYRNKFSHAGQDSTLEKDEFNMYWMDISQAIMRLSNGELQADVYKLQKETEHNERKSCDDKKNG